MKNFLLTISMLLISVCLFAQASDSMPANARFHSEIAKLNAKIKMLEKNNSSQAKKIDSISAQLSIASSNIQRITDSLQVTASNVLSSDKQTQNQIQDISHSITNKTLYWVIGILVVCLLISIIIFFVLSGKLSLSAKNLESQVAKTNETLQDKTIRLDEQIAETNQTIQSEVVKMDAHITNFKQDFSKEIIKLDAQISSVNQSLKNELAKVESKLDELGKKNR